MATELHFQCKETERLLDKNQSLLEENQVLKRNLLIHKDLENELARRTHVYQKLIKKMQSREKSTVSYDKSANLEESLEKAMLERSLPEVMIKKGTNAADAAVAVASAEELERS